jgi:DNA-binding transcriptional MerR regulator
MANHKKNRLVATADLPLISDKVYFTIGEVGYLCDLEPHVLRYWEQEFGVLRPVKRRGNRRYYKRKDIDTVREIRELLYFQGFTIEGARQRLATALKTGKKHAAGIEEGRKVPHHAIIQSLEQVLVTLGE